LALLVFLWAVPTTASGASGALTLAWRDLQPAGEAAYNAKIAAALTAGLYDAIRKRRVNEYQSEATVLRSQLKSGVVAALDGKHVRIPGYVVPLDFDDGGRIKEFLLVPFYGACIHVPAPPSNQILHVFLPRPREITELQLPIWAEGRLAVRPSSSPLAPASYQLSLTAVQAYSGQGVPYDGPTPHSDGR
jgi:hypothetical protein